MVWSWVYNINHMAEGPIIQYKSPTLPYFIGTLVGVIIVAGAVFYFVSSQPPQPAPAKPVVSQARPPAEPNFVTSLYGTVSQVAAQSITLKSANSANTIYTLTVAPESRFQFSDAVRFDGDALKYLTAGDALVVETDSNIKGATKGTVRNATLASSANNPAAGPVSAPLPPQIFSIAGAVKSIAVDRPRTSSEPIRGQLTMESDVLGKSQTFTISVTPQTRVSNAANAVIPLTSITSGSFVIIETKENIRQNTLLTAANLKTL